MTASLLSLATATAPYAVQVAGNILAPKVYDGDLLAIQPAVNREETPTPGSLVLVALEDAHHPGRFQQTGIFQIDGDGDLHAGNTHIERGKYVLLGIEIPQN